MSPPPLRIIGTSSTLTAELCRAARRDLPFPIEFEVLDGPSCMRRGVLKPESYDIYDQWFYSLDVLWTAGAIQAIDTSRIRRWPEVRIAGQIPGSAAKQVGAPSAQLFVRHDGTLAERPDDPAPPRIGMLPTTYNADSFGYARELLAELAPNETESWAWLLDDRWHGRCTLSLDPAGSAVELALAARAAGLVDVRDPGNLTIEEIDALFQVLLSLKRRGHFTRFWGTSEDSVALMAGGNAVIGSLWSPAYYALRGMGRDIIHGAPREGYRGWHSGLCLSANVTGAMRDAAYAYLNWWLDGTPGAIMARQGYYVSVVDTLRETLSQAEWDYWYEGKPASEDLPGLAATIAVRRGETREGGNYLNRVARISAWSTVMPEHNYLARRWREFLEL
ncbi:PotD/PotF family extracellular solute-binding protein [Tabrizicola sp.]|uniref:ABC transporter substrate-binding protein n=1 Tax=Tabrizicola sp. TaxID=2005166 RepID=UPI0035B0ADC8